MIMIYGKGFKRAPTPWINVMDTVNKDTIVSTFKTNVGPNHLH